MVIFSGKPMTLMPISMDFGVLVDHLKLLRLEEVPFGGTNIGDALSMCVYHLEKEKTKSKVVILLTDGENNSGYTDPMAAAKIAKEKGIRVYTIGVGSIQGAPIPYNTPYGKRYAQENGKMVIPKLDATTLKTIARYTGGKFFRATDEKTLANVFENISKLEKSEIRTSRSVLYSEQAHIFMMLAFGLFLAAILLETGPLRRLE
jgi:Ca-activated chloride channel family protein